MSMKDAATWLLVTEVADSTALRSSARRTERGGARRFTMRNTLTEDKLTNAFASEDNTTRDALTAHIGLALTSRCHLAWASEGTVVGPGMDTHGTTVPPRREAVGGPKQAPRNTTADKTLVANMVAEPVS